MSFPGPLGIAGVGLIGGSIALRARAAGIETIGFDPNPDSAALVDRTAPSLAALAAQSKVVALALPIDATLAAIDELRALNGPGPELVFDVASVKGAISARAAGWAGFIATHPIAGAEGGGPKAARADLFEGRTWTYVPCGDARDETIAGLIRTLGASPLAIGAEEHDRALALTSHLPQIVVSTLGAALAAAGPPAELAGPGLISTLRLAGSPWPLWEAIVRANAPTLAAALRDVGTRLTSVAEGLEEGDLAELKSYFESARTSYDLFVRGTQNR